MVEVTHAFHRRRPALVAQQVERNQFEPRKVGAVPAKRVAHLVRLASVADAAAYRIARLKELQRDMSADETGYAGDENAVQGRLRYELNELYDIRSIRSNENANGRTPRSDLQ